MEKSEQRKIVGKILDASILIARKGRTVMDQGYFYAPWIPAELEIGVRKKIMHVKEWLEEKRKNQHSYMSIDAEEELTKLLTEEIAKKIEKERRAQNGRK